MSSEEQDFHFDTGDAGGSGVYPVSAGSIKKGGYCMLKGFPCKVNDYSTAKVGKHGSAKAKIIGADIFTNNKYEEICPTSHNMEVPVVTRKTYTVMAVIDGHTSLLGEDGSTRDDVSLPPDAELAAKIEVAIEKGETTVNVVVQAAVGHEQIVEVKEVS
eukprot:GHVH01005632.1.p1 GENE.GHVH01005632.1~~GHVH01005632.1.p1  ORF type:complete len:159 (+),score=32.03 GHVH01005632.1:190-666(+)